MDIYAGTLSSAIGLINRMSNAVTTGYYVGCELDEEMVLYAQFRLNEVWRSKFGTGGMFSLKIVNVFGGDEKRSELTS